MLVETPFDDSWGGTISFTEFRIAAHNFVEKWRLFDTNLPPWSWIPCPISPFSSSPDDGYLCLENVCIFRPVVEEDDDAAREEFKVLKEEEEEFVDAAMLVEGGNEELHFYDFHIVYSSTYRVPLLYFRKHRSDGQPLSLEDIEKHLLPTQSAEELLKSKWTFITQEEHPYLMRPWYKLHACGTAEWMKLLFLANSATSVGKNGATLELYLISWLSVVGQAVGLKIPLEMLNKFV